MVFESASHGGPAEHKKPICVRERSSKWYTTTTVGISLFTDTFLYSVVIPALPYSLESQYGISRDDIQFWTSTTIVSYGAAILIASPVVGLIADNTKARRWPYLCGLLILFAATTMLCFGRSALVLISARILQGISAAIVWVVGLALLVDSIGNQNISRAMGFAALGSSAAILLGPLLGGVMYDHVGLRGLYCVCLGLLVVSLILRLSLIESKTAELCLGGEKQPDVLSVSTPATNDIVVNISYPADMPPVLSLLTSGRLLCAIFSTFMSAILISTFDAIIPLFALDTLGLSSTGAGLVFAAVIIPGLLSPLIGWLCDRYGARWIVSSGYILFSPILLCLRFVDSDDPTHMILFCGLLGGIGLSYSMVSVPMLSEYTRVVAQKEKLHPGIFGARGVYAQAYGMYNIGYSAGTLVGPLLGGYIMEKYGFAVTTASLAICCGFTAVITAIFCGERVSCSYHTRRDITV